MSIGFDKTYRISGFFFVILQSLLGRHFFIQRTTFLGEKNSLEGLFGAPRFGKGLFEKLELKWSPVEPFFDFKDLKNMRG